ncbi:MAG: hypothetical protein Q9192_006868 [Flavoplaca navasiana]
MRLIDTLTYEIREISPGNKPTYAILSHTWGNDEYIFSDRDKSQRRHSAGFEKISRCCALAASQGYEHLWVDTCCIDKTSSAELTESINSMYRWYEEAKICYVYLSDFFLKMAQHGIGTRFDCSRWFTRGWTLQELLAPENVVFYDADWTEIGSKTFLKNTLSGICRISVRHLSQPKEASVATKMSWASTRKTTREEDTAYCLLGLFGVNMPLIYGEGANAFFRLQCEIIQSSSDESLFAWRDRYNNFSAVYYGGLLAAGPRCFEESGGIVPICLKDLDRPPYFLTNQGLSIEVVPFGAGYQREHSDDFKRALLANKDSRMNGRETDAERPHIVKIVLACAREETKGAPVMLKLGIIAGKLASRIDCDRLELDFDAIHATKSVFSSWQSSRQTYLIGWQHTFQNANLRLSQDSQWIGLITTHISQTSTFQKIFTLNERGSQKYTTILPGDSILVYHHEEGIPLDIVKLHFESPTGYCFSLEWDSPKPFRPVEYFMRFTDFSTAMGQPVPSTVKSQRLQTEPCKEIGFVDNLSAAIDDRLYLWISTKRKPDEPGQHSVVLDVTPIDRSKALHSSLDSD